MYKKLYCRMLFIVLITATLLAAVPVLAQMGQTKLGPVRCGSKLIQIGMTKQQILAACGKPTTESPGRHGGGAVWTYNRGTTGFTGILRFTGPQLTSIERGDYGFAQPVYGED
jgi:hypothetical protein